MSTHEREIVKPAVLEIPDSLELHPDLEARARRDIDWFLRRFNPIYDRNQYTSDALERGSFMGEDQHRAFIDLMVSLGLWGRALFTRGHGLRYIYENRRKFPAIDRMNTGPDDRWAVRDMLLFMWDHLNMGRVHNAAGVRNRTRIDEKTVHEFLMNGFRYGQIDILSIAGGSGRAITKALAKVPPSVAEKVHTMIVDRDERAIASSARVAAEHQLPRSPLVVIADVLRMVVMVERGEELPQFPSGYRPHFVEVVGLLDYFGDRTIVRLLKWIRKIMHPGGQMLISNIDNRDIPGEDRFREDIVGWDKMFLRSADHLGCLAEAIPGVKVKVFSEPLGVYNLAKITVNE